MPSDIETYYLKGLEALKNKNYDYAIEILLQIVQEDPLFLPAREALHKAEREKYKHIPQTTLSKLSNAININTIIAFMQALFYESQKNYQKAIAFYEDLLHNNPHNKYYLNKIYQNAMKNNWHDVAVIALESLFAIDNQNAELAEKIGTLYRDKENVDKARFYLQKSLQLQPLNQRASKLLKDIEALHAIQKGGWDKETSYRDKIKDKETAEELEKESKLRSPDNKTDIKVLEEKLNADPENVNLWASLIKKLIACKEYKRAEAQLAEAAKKFKNSPVLKTVEYYLKEALLTEKREKLTPADKIEAENLEKEIKKIMIGRLKHEAELIPNDLELKYKLGLLLYEAGNYTKAIAEFQKAAQDPALALKSTYMLGKAFYEKKMYDLSLLQFQKALDKVKTKGDIFKEITYELGKTFEAMGRTEEALKEYKKIYEIDISYKDVSKKIESMYN